MRLVLVILLFLLPSLSSADTELDNMIESYELQKSGDYLNNQELASLSHEIGIRLLANKKYGSAITYFKTALEIAQNIDINDPYLGGRWTYLGQAYTFDGQINNGLQSLQRALQIDEQHYPSGHLYIGISHGNLGWALIRSRNYRMANEHLKIACAIFSTELGENHPQTLDCDKKMSVTLKHLNNKQQ
ncbi:hypothetical protein PSEMO_45870 [Pseudomonas putida]|uniref:Uncharacterized protein n=2 Tax=Pseudomonas putida TaxID=303 RepID=A0A1Q9QZI4_PSEPU|nr:hypothetical protein PSEMO_45870 [Pseudomonas putida]